jgi:hypothetical protein
MGRPRQIVDSSFTTIINAPIDKVDIPARCLSLPEREYQGFSPTHIATGFATAPDGKRMSINVEFAAELGYLDVYRQISRHPNPRS